MTTPREAVEGAPVEGSLGARAARGAAVTVAGQLARAGLQLIGLVVLARLLLPSDYGLLASVTAIVGVGEVLRDFGLSSAAVQARTVSAAQRSNLFWLNTAVAAVLATAAVLAAPGIAAFYGDPRLADITRALAVTLVLNGLAAQYRADLNRRMRFAALAVVDVVALALSLAVAVVLAALGQGVTALVVQQLVLAGGAALGVVACARWRPSWPRRGTPMRGFLRFGWNLMGSNLLGYASRNVDSVVVGRLFGAAPLGAYNRAFQILLLPLNQLNAPLTRVALPVLARLQDDPPRFMAFLLRGQTTLVTGVIALFATTSAVAEPLFRVVLGPDWGPSAHYFQLLAFGGCFQTAGYVVYWVFLATGRTGAGFRYSLVARPVVIAAILVGAFGGVAGVAAGYSVGTALIWPLGLWWIGRITGLPAWQLFANGVRPLLTFGTAGLGGWLLVDRVAAGHVGDVLQVLLGVAVTGVVVAVWALVWPRFRRDLGELVTTAMMVVRRRRVG